MKRLIFNADDLGMNTARTHGIFQAFEQGVVRSATLIPTGDHADVAAKWAREKGLPTGIHLSLTDGWAKSKPGDIETLLRPNGEFLDRDELERLLAEDRIDRTHIERELRAQVEWFFDAHGSPTHVDGHHHIHIHPTVIPLLLPILDRYGIAFVRIPSEPLPPHGWIISEERVQTLQKICDRADAARSHYTAHGIRSTDNFRGLALAGNASRKNLRHILTRFPEGSTEIMVHPGSAAAMGTPFDMDPQRQTELNMLIDDGLPALFKKYDIELSSFADLY